MVLTPWASVVAECLCSGQSGYLLITIAPLLSTASAINATLYGSMRLSYIIAKDGELPDGSVPALAPGRHGRHGAGHRSDLRAVAKRGGSRQD